MDDNTQFLVRAESTIIGSLIVSHWDRLNGVAGGAFQPNESYLPDTHANDLDGVDLSALAERPRLSIVTDTGEPLQYDTAYLFDRSASMGENAREITLFGVNEIPQRTVP